jgi:hypothetical protein
MQNSRLDPGIEEASNYVKPTTNTRKGNNTTGNIKEVILGTPINTP